MTFRDRKEAGTKLAEKLVQYAKNPIVLVLGLARGGVAVAAEVARILDVPLDVFVVRKLGFPGHEELAIGAIASGGATVLDTEIIQGYGIPDEEVDAIQESERRELERREHAYRDDEPPADVIGRIVILVDDGIATGSSMRAAIAALRPRHPAKIVVAIPVAPASTVHHIEREVDEVVCLSKPKDFLAVGEWYEDFQPVSDRDVRRLLEAADLRLSVHAT
ncbi:MAG TPA: phosphoribosyltransferase [Candidatus Limnocylindrales bacterium]|nr:phosphoribosyltransferase [Candidatus Limnocylindrales bacterium]